MGAEMDLRTANDSESRFAGYVEGLVSVIGHADRAGPLRDYCRGLMLPCERKSVEPMAAVTAPADGGAASVACCILSARRRGRTRSAGQGARAGAAGDRASRPDRSLDHRRHRLSQEGRHSVGVARQYCGQLGKQDNCQVAVSLSIANHHASLPVAYRLYLPEDWAEDRMRRRKAGVPEEISFKTKPEIALEQIRWACEAGLPRGVVLMDAGYGTDTELRRRSRAGVELCRRHPAEHLGLGAGHGAAAAQDLVGSRATAEADAPRRRAPADLGQGARARPAQARLAHDHLARRHGRMAVLALCARAGAVAHRDYQLHRGRPEEWLLIEWPEGEDEPTKYWLSTLAEDIAFRVWSMSPSCAGASSATIRSSSRRSGSGISRGAAGAASTITPPCASRPTDS